VGSTNSEQASPGRIEERYRAYLRTSSEAIWCFELDEPISIHLPSEVQVGLIFRRAWLAECNDAMARMYGYTSCDEITATRLPDLLIESDPRNVLYLRRFVEAGYRLQNEETVERDRSGEPRYFLNNLVGVVEDGMLARAWGTQRDITPRKLAEETQRRYRALFEATPDGLMVVDEEGNCDDVNPAMCRILKASREDLLGRSFSEFVPPSILPDVIRAFDTLKDAGSFSGEFPLRATDGSIVELAWSSRGSFYPGYHLFVVREIGAAKQQEAEMQAALARYADVERRLTLLTSGSGRLISRLERSELARAIVDLGIELVQADAVAVWRFEDATWRIEAHAGLSDAFLANAVERAGPSLESDDPVVYPDVFAAATLQSRHELYRREGIKSVLFAPLKVGGEVAGTVVFYSRSEGRFTDVDRRTTAALSNVSASALHNAALYEGRRTAEAHAHFLAEAGSLLASTLDVEATLGRIAQLAVPRLGDWCAVHLLRDDGAIEQLAASHSNPAKLRWAEQLRTKYPSHLGQDNVLAEVIRSGTSQLAERLTDEMLIHTAKDPQHLELLRALELRSVLIVPLRRADHNVGAITLATSSESRRRLGQAELALAESLAARAALAIENARLYRQAQEANELKDQFIATLSHELRTPLNALLGWSRMLADGILDASGAARALQAIQRNAQTQAQLVGDILELSRILSGKIELTLEPVEIGSLVREITESLQPMFEQKSLRVQTTFDGSLIANADRSRLQQVVLNLLTNAAKFTPEGGQVFVAGRADGVYAEIAFRDTGVGIAPEFLPHVFERFRQGEPSTSRTYGGLGIGLSVSRHLLELHRGTITAHSDGLGTGATFIVRLPMDLNVASVAR
jgi:PAS domain S-box-containing protein